VDDYTAFLDELLPPEVKKYRDAEAVVDDGWMVD
jgi:hypothetical protein